MGNRKKSTRKDPLRVYGSSLRRWCPGCGRELVERINAYGTITHRDRKTGIVHATDSCDRMNLARGIADATYRAWEDAE